MTEAASATRTGPHGGTMSTEEIQTSQLGELARLAAQSPLTAV